MCRQIIDMIKTLFWYIRNKFCSSVSQPNILDRIDCKMTGPSLRSFYKDVNNPDHSFRIKKWFFSSANEIMLHQNNHGSKMLDIAVNYLGMGRVVILSYIPLTDKFFFRHRGGPTSYDCEKYDNMYSDDKFVPSELPVYRNSWFRPLCEQFIWFGWFNKSTNIQFSTLVQYNFIDTMHLVEEF